MNICPISEQEMKFVFSELILGKYDVAYYVCDHCGILRTEEPFWLEEAYSEAIGKTDTGVVERSLRNQKLLEPIIHRMFGRSGKFLDVGGGYGLLARLMRDRGFNCYTADKYCKNLFAVGFEPNSDFNADALFAFEVLEHIRDPLEFIKISFNLYKCSTLIFSTLDYGLSVPPRDWWYYAFEGGQHITFYQSRTFALLAERLGCSYHKLHGGFHLISDRPMSRIDKLLFSSANLRRIYSFYVKRHRNGLSKVWEDHLTLKNNL
jgi:hypothetical protein